MIELLTMNPEGENFRWASWIAEGESAGSKDIYKLEGNGYIEKCRVTVR